MLRVRLPPGPLTIALADQRSGRHPLKVKVVGSNPIQGTDETCRLGTGEPRWL